MRASAFRALPGLALGLVLVVRLATPAFAGRVLTVDVREPFVVDGRAFGPSPLSFRPGATFTPSTRLDEVRVGGTSLGLLAVQTRKAEGGPTQDAAVFTRDAQGRLVLLGYVVRDGADAGSRRLIARAGSGTPDWSDRTALVIVPAR